MSERIEYLRLKAAAATSYICGERGRIVTDSYRDTEGEAPVIRRAIALRRELRLGRGSVEWLDSEPGVLHLRNGTTGIVLNTPEQPVAIEGAGKPLITSWHRSGADAVDAAGVVVVPSNGACWLDASAGGTDGGDPR